MTQILGLIPARGGSKGIPLKNIHPLAGRPLLAYTCQAALKSKMLSRVILSTDHKKIASVGERYGVDVPFLRPRKYSLDTSPSIDVVTHALKWLADEEKWIPDIVVLLQPTSPLRRSKHIDEAVELFISEQVDTVVSVIKVPHQFSPYSIQKLEDGLLKDYYQDELGFDRYRRQNMPILYARNGPAILVSSGSVIKKCNGFYGDTILPFIMEEEDSIDIDNTFDLQLAECMLNSRKGGC